MMTKNEATTDEQALAVPLDLPPRTRARLLRDLPRILRSAADSLALAQMRAEHDPEGALCHLVFVRDAVSLAFAPARRMSETPARAWGATKGSWNAGQKALVDRFRPLYLAEVARFAEALRPQFEAGELRGYREEIDGVDLGRATPLERLEDMCAEHFGLRTDHAAEGLVISVSPSAAAATLSGAGVRNAVFACAWDVLAVARARGWYTPTRDECPAPSKTKLPTARKAA